MARTHPSYKSSRLKSNALGYSKQLLDDNAMLIQPFFQTTSSLLKTRVQAMQDILKQLLPEELLCLKKSSFKQAFEEHLPLIQFTECSMLPDSLSIFLLCPPLKKIRTEDYFLEAVKRCLLPEKDLFILSFQHLHFHFSAIDKTSYFIAEVKILIEDRHDQLKMQTNLPLWAKEMKLRISSDKYAELLQVH